MEVSSTNDIKIYNLSCGKSLPDFISDRKRRTLLKNDVSLRRRIELVQDFTMPTVSNKVDMTKDGQYIYVVGTYKPKVRCYDASQLSLKFERGLDAEVVTFKILSEDYSKVVFLFNDRYLEFHSQGGRYYRLRMPKFGRDMAYHPATCELYLVGAGEDIYRLNLDHGKFYKSFTTQSPEVNVCSINDDHHLLCVGTVDGKIECWDPRSRKVAGQLDCTNSATFYTCPEISAVKWKDPLKIAVGLSTGQILLYDIRSNRPYISKDHHNELPIHTIAFNNGNDIVISSDKRSVKLWNEKNGSAITAIESEPDINDMCMVDNSGLFFLANEAPKLQTYFIPMLGPAPKWASFLDSLTEELEENPVQEIYDDYKFVTMKEIDELGLKNLIGSNLLRAYMHGYFMDMRLYQKTKAIAQPFAYEEYRQKKIKEKIEESRSNRVQIKKLPKVNKVLANRLLMKSEEENPNSGKKKQKKKEAQSLLLDDRFNAMFEDPSFQINEESEEFRMINPVVTKQVEKKRKKDVAEEIDDNDNPEKHSSDEEESNWITDSNKIKHKNPKLSEPKMFRIKEDKNFNTLQDLTKIDKEKRKEEKRRAKASLEERIADEIDNARFQTNSNRNFGNKTLVYKTKKPKEEDTKFNQKHDRSKTRRSAKNISKPGRPGFFTK